MKRAVLILFTALAVAGCGTSPSVENKPSNVAANTGSTNGGNSITSNSSNTGSAPPALIGEKVSSPVTIKFGPEGIPAGWKWLDPDGKDARTNPDTSSGVLKFIVPSGKDLYGDNRTAIQLLKAVDGDFQIETRVKFDPIDDYQGAGILVYIDPVQYLRFERAFGGVGGGTNGLRLDARLKNEYRPITTPDDVPTAAGVVDLKLIRIGKIFTAFWRLDENGEWREVGEFVSDYPDTVQIGLIACNTGAPIPVEFSYIKLAPAK